jgi:hypothetical protein
MSWCRAQSGAHDHIFITVWQLRSCFCGAPSLTRGRVCILYMLLGLPNAVFLGSESLGTRDHILLSHIWDFPFRRLLRLAGSRWRYLAPPPHGLRTNHLLFFHYVPSIWYDKDHTENTVSNSFSAVGCVFAAMGTCLPKHWLATRFGGGGGKNW